MKPKDLYEWDERRLLSMLGLFSDDEIVGLADERTDVARSFARSARDRMDLDWTCRLAERAKFDEIVRGVDPSPDAHDRFEPGESSGWEGFRRRASLSHLFTERGMELAARVAYNARAEIARGNRQWVMEHAFDIAIAAAWRDAGRPRYAVSDSLAALFALTKAPTLDWSSLPHEAFVVEVPSRYLPAATGVSRIVVARVGNVGVLTAFTDAGALRAFQHTAIDEDIAESSEADRWLSRMVVRMASNVTTLLLQHRPCAVARKRSKTKPDADNVFDTRPPVEVTITRTIRDRAAELVGARSFKAAKRVLRHVVRGHWKRIAVGHGRAERKMVFVAPYERGDQRLGLVVERISRLES